MDSCDSCGRSRYDGHRHMCVRKQQYAVCNPAVCSFGAEGVEQSGTAV